MNTTRRQFLRSSSALIALPVFSSFEHKAFAAAKKSKNQLPPKRLMFLSFGWGVTEESWYPDINTPGADYKLPDGLSPLKRHKKDFSVIQGLYNKHSHDGHSGSTFWLTGANRYSQAGVSFTNSVSADQVAAQQFGRHTRFTSMPLNGSHPKISGDGHGEGLSLAWDNSGKPVAGYNSPFAAYHKLFSKGDVSIDQLKTMLNQKRSILDTIQGNAKYLQKKLGKNDSLKLDEYLASIRDIETRLVKEEQWFDIPKPKATLKEPPKEADGKQDIKLMYDIMIAALQTDSTRVITYRQPVRTLLKSIGVNVNQHDMSHYHQTRAEKLDASERRDKAQSALLSGLLDKLKSTKEADGSSLYDHTSLVYGSNIRTGHSLDNCPTIVAGGGAKIKMGENLVVRKDTPLCNLWLTLLKESGVKVDKHGDSTGVLDEIKA
ncbi:MAG: DUF1552 domain-containing protein [Lentisphaeraceae bacterium]|nr:DUF1552 domain-containing protein [Lentisphaeraceae bacterium]